VLLLRLAINPVRSTPALRLSIRIEAHLLALRPRLSLFELRDVPIGTATLEYRAQFETKLLHRRPAEEASAREHKNERIALLQLR